MNSALWHLELLRTLRTPGLLIATALMVLFGVTSPIMALYANEIIAALDPTGTAPAMPAPTPQSSIATFLSNASGPLLLANVLIAAMALAFDSRSSRALFYRTLVHRTAALILPRWAVASSVVVLAHILGSLCAWASTSLLLGAVTFWRYLLGTLLSCVYFTFVTAVVALAAGLVRNVLAVLGVTAGILAAMAILAQVPVISEWTPSALTGAQAVLVDSGGAAFFVRALVVTAALNTTCLSLSVWLCSRREF